MIYIIAIDTVYRIAYIIIAWTELVYPISGCVSATHRACCDGIVFVLSFTPQKDQVHSRYIQWTDNPQILFSSCE